MRAPALGVEVTSPGGGCVTTPGATAGRRQGGYADSARHLAANLVRQGCQGSTRRLAGGALPGGAVVLLLRVD
jgi:hypothetical protein